VSADRCHRDAEFPGNRRHNEQAEVEGIEHPPEPRRNPGKPLVLRGFFPPRDGKTGSMGNYSHDFSPPAIEASRACPDAPDRALSRPFLSLTASLFFRRRYAKVPCGHDLQPWGTAELLYLFNDFALDTERRELSREAALVAIAPQAFDLLAYLIRNRERVISKEELLASIWNGRVVSDAALSTRINAARRAIDDTGDEQRFIRTLPRKGIRFIGTVHEEQRPAPAHEPNSVAEYGSPLLIFPDRPSIAVLPFVNMSGDAKQDYFVDGVAEEIITALSRCSGLFCNCTELVICLQGQISRCPPGWTRTRRPLHTGRQRPARWRPAPLYWTAHRRRVGGTYLGRSVRRQYGEYLGASGPVCGSCCRSDRTEAAAR
jgi:DNA-binding winged helix-turn-helix (wHTH) protein